MTEENAQANADVLGMTADIVAAYVRNNPLPASELGRIIAETFVAVSKLQTAPGPQPEEKRAPAVPIKKSVTPDFHHLPGRRQEVQIAQASHRHSL